MQNFDEIKNIWQQTETERSLPSAKEIMMQIEKYRKKMIRKKILLTVTLGLTFIFISAIPYYYDSKFWTTTAGILLVLIAIVLGMILNTRLVLLLLKQGDTTLDNKSFLRKLITFRTNQRFMQTTGLSIYFILLSAGLFLYMLEFALKDVQFAIISYLMTFAWIAVNWFYFRKKTITKNKKEIDTQISMIKKLINSMEH